MRRHFPGLLAACSLAYLVLLVLHLVGRPIGTDDLWWHLKLGEFYLSDGPWLASDPLLHTAREGPPAPATWLFDVFAHLTDRLVGLHGLRVVHVALAGTILLLAYSLFRREARSHLAACLAVSVFAIVSWYRLFQFRPELVSILLAFVLYRLLFEAGGAPAWRRVAVATALLLLWANMHALYLIGPLLCLAALIGVGLRMLLAGWGAGKGDGRLSETARCGRPAGRLAAALALGLLAGSLNPAGASRHLTFWKSSREAQIWRIGDEWAPFDPFHWSGTGEHTSLLVWLLTNALVAGVVLAAIWGARRFLRRPCAETLDAVDPMLLGLAASSLVAILVAIRFQWMAIFPLLFLLRSGRAALAGQPRLRVPARWTIAALCVALAVAFPRLGGYGARAQGLRNAEIYFSRAFDVRKYAPEGVRFLMETGVEGKLFNSYFVGSFLGYWLAPGLRGFLNHTLNVPDAVIDEARAIEAQRGLRPQESFLDILDRRSVDFFVGQGLPMASSRPPAYTAAHLEGAPGWILVFRSLRTAIYMRDEPRNRANLERIERYYEHEAVPFDLERGLDVAAVLRQRPDWAVAHGMAPREYPSLVRARENAPQAARLQVLDRLGQSYAAIGAYAEQVELDRSLLALRPDTRSALRRLVYGLLRLDRPKEARNAASRLLRLDPDDPRSRIFAAAAARYAELRRAQPELHPAQGLPIPPSAVINGLPLFTPAEITGLVRYSAEQAALSAVRDASSFPPPTEVPEAAEVTFDEEGLLEALGYLASEPAHSTTGVVRHDRTSAHQGWNLYVSQHGQEAHLLDMDGETLHVWKGSPREELELWWRTVRLFPGGEILAQTDHGSLARLDRNSKILWVFQDRTHHDFDVRDDGHIFVLTRSPGRFPMFRGTIGNDFVVELDPGGAELRRLSILQALIDGGPKEIVDELVAFQRGEKGPAKFEPLHANSVEILDGSLAGQLPAFARGNLLISLCMVGRIVVLDFDAGRVVWSLKGSFRYQHHPTMLANGHMLIFDNKGLGDERSRILEIDPVTGEEVWSYGARESEAFYSACCGRVYRLPNGNTLVIASKTARAFEVDPNGRLVWEFRSPHEILGRVAILNDLLRLPPGSVPAQDPRPAAVADDGGSG